MCPVDSVAQSIVHIATQTKSEETGKVFHYTNNNPISVLCWLEVLQSCGIQVEREQDYDKWLARVSESPHLTLYLIHFCVLHSVGLTAIDIPS